MVWIAGGEATLGSQNGDAPLHRVRSAALDRRDRVTNDQLKCPSRRPAVTTRAQADARGGAGVRRTCSPPARCSPAAGRRGPASFGAVPFVEGASWRRRPGRSTIKARKHCRHATGATRPATRSGRRRAAAGVGVRRAGASTRTATWGKTRRSQAVAGEHLERTAAEHARGRLRRHRPVRALSQRLRLYDVGNVGWCQTGTTRAVRRRREVG